MSDTPSSARLLDQGTPPERFARGWHCLGLKDAFADGQPHGIEAFGTKLVVWQDTQGDINVLDGYCRHMGGDLTQGSVKGDEVACPLHDWRWGGDGKCKAIPYARRVPLRARTQKYPVVIRNGQVLIWHDVEGVFEGTQATQYMESKGRPDKGGGYGDAELFLKSEATYCGPAYMINWLDADYEGFQTEVILINCHIPTGPDSFTLHYGTTVKKPVGLDDKTAQYIAKKYAEMFGDEFLQDVHIWKNKVPVQNPLLGEEDGPVYQLRRWYEQFYVDQADIAPEMVDRFEFEVDTTKANEYWQEEVAENLRKKAEEEASGSDADATAESGSPQIMTGT